MKKRKVYIDMDDTAVDYSTQLSIYSQRYPQYPYPQSVIGFFSGMKAKVGFMEAWEKLEEHYELRFLTRPSIFNINSYSEKAQWVLDHLGHKEGVYVLERLVLACHKEEVGEKGDFLIDDWDIHGQPLFKGEFIRFGQNGRIKTWKEVVEYLIAKATEEKVANPFTKVSDNLPVNGSYVEGLTNYGDIVKVRYEDLLGNTIWEYDGLPENENEEILAWRYA
jgi:hypothetical protein